MSRGPPRLSPPPARVVGIGAAVVAMVVLVLALGSMLPGEGEGSAHPPPLLLEESGAPAERGGAIRGEFEVGRARVRQRAVAPSASGDSAAHPRTLSIYRSLRAYPGAPPRIPHGLTTEEFRSTTCNNCHERGGFSPRFGAYVPVTPHPELSACLQCHVPRDALVGIPLPDRDPSDTCGQCHLDPEAPPPSFVASGWIPAAWPETGSRALPEGPLRIPHGLELRRDCLACHTGPGAVREIRTDHPERESCLQCHVPGAEGRSAGPHPLGGPGEPPGGVTPGGELNGSRGRSGEGGPRGEEGGGS